MNKLIKKNYLIILLSLSSFYLYNLIDRYIADIEANIGVSVQFFMLIPLLFLGFKHIKILRKKAIFYSPFIFLLAYVTYTLSVTTLYHPSTLRESLTYVTQFIVFIGGIYLANTVPTLILFEYIRKSSIIVGVVFFSYIFYHILLGNIQTLVGLDGENRLNINHISSTEYTIYIGSLYFLFLFSAKLSTDNPKKIGLLLLSLLSALLTFFSGATSPAIMIILLTALYIVLNQKKLVRFFSFFILFIIVLFTLLSTSLYERTANKISGIYESDQNNIRALIYTDIIENIKEKPMIGIGLNTYRFIGVWYQGTDGVVTHNNILGIAVASGIPASIFYIIFILWSLIKIFRNISIEKNEKLRIFFITIFCIIIYQQSRGLIQDTWALKEIPFWIGIFLGILLNAKTKNSHFNFK